MNCGKTYKLMSDYLDDCLPGHVRLEFEIHIAECGDCASELQGMEDMLRSLKGLSSRGMPVDCWSAVRAGVERQRAPRGAWLMQLLRPVYAAPVAAAILLLVIMLVRPAPVSEQIAPSHYVSLPEYGNYISAHSRARRMEPLSDPDVVFVAAELEKANLFSHNVRP